jgi:hypothetical protein
MLHNLIIRRLVPWSDFNEYEGEIEGLLDTHEVCCYVLMSSEEEWQAYSPGETKTVNFWLERNGSVTIMEPSNLMTLHQIEGVNYEVIGTVTYVSEETVLLNSVVPMRVDLDLDIGADLLHEIPEIHVGDQIRVEGILKVDLDPAVD